MQAAVYRGGSVVSVEEIPTPSIGPGEILIRVEACGICHTDLKKIEYNLLAPPRVYGHETAGVVVATGSGVTKFTPGDRVVAFHHIPCRQCFYVRNYTRNAVYKGQDRRVRTVTGTRTVRACDGWIVDGRRRSPMVSPSARHVSRTAQLLPKAVVQCDPQPGDLVVILGRGPIGLMFSMLTRRRGACGPPTRLTRLELASQCGAEFARDPRKVDVAAEAAGLPRPRCRSGNRGCVGSRHRGRAWLARDPERAFCFAQTSAKALKLLALTFVW